jgi:hypothetical protein
MTVYFGRMTAVKVGALRVAVLLERNVLST